MKENDLAVEKKYTEAMKLAGYVRIPVNGSGIATVAFKELATGKELGFDGWNLVGGELKDLYMNEITDSNVRTKMKELLPELLNGKNLRFYVAQGAENPEYYEDFKSACNNYFRSAADGRVLGFDLNGDHVAMSEYSEAAKEYSNFFPREIDMDSYISTFASREEKDILIFAQDYLNASLALTKERPVLTPEGAAYNEDIVGTYYLKDGFKDNVEQDTEGNYVIVHSVGTDMEKIVPFSEAELEGIQEYTDHRQLDETTNRYILEESNYHKVEFRGIVGEVSFANGEVIEYTDPEEYVRAINEEIEYSNTSGFRYETLSKDPELKKTVDDIVYDLAGEENPKSLSDYILSSYGEDVVGTYYLKDGFKDNVEFDKSGNLIIVHSVGTDIENVMPFSKTELESIQEYTDHRHLDETTNKYVLEESNYSKHEKESAYEKRPAEQENNLLCKGFANVPGKDKPYILYGESPEAIIKRLQSFNEARPENDRFSNCNIGWRESDGKYAGYHKYEVATGKDISSIYLSIPPMKKEEFNKTVEYLKENGNGRMPVPSVPEVSYTSAIGTIDLEYCVQLNDGKKIHLGTKELGKPIDEIATAGEAVDRIEKAVAKTVVSENIKHAGYQPNDQLVGKYLKFNDLTGKNNAVSDICNAFKTGKYSEEPEIDTLVKDMGKLFQQQEIMKQANIAVVGG